MRFAPVRRAVVATITAAGAAIGNPSLLCIGQLDQ